MAPPRAGTNELGGSATAVRPAVEAGEDSLIRETCWARVVTEKVTVTVIREGKINRGDGDVHEREKRTTKTESKDEVRGDRERTRSETKGSMGVT